MSTSLASCALLLKVVGAPDFWDASALPLVEGVEALLSDARSDSRPLRARVGLLCERASRSSAVPPRASCP
eukprot:scaffold754_cov248-Pinguiococcus_pyrenoidosus.AAC.38